MRNSLFFVFLLCSGITFAQIEQPYRYEKSVKPSEEDFTIIPLKEEGIAVVRATNKYKSGNRTWEMILLDTTLQEKWTMEFEVEGRSDLIGMEHSPGLIHTLFMKNEFGGDMHLVSISIASKEVSKFEIKPELNFKLTHFNSVGTNFIFGGLINLEPGILAYTPSSENLKVVPGFFQKNTELIDIRVNQNQTFNTIVLDRSNPDNKKIVFKTFDQSGKVLLEDETIIDPTISIQSSISSNLYRDDLLIVGTWGKKNSKLATSFYSLSINPFSDEKIKSVYFGQLDHYLDYLKPKKIAAVKKNTERALEKNEIPSFTNYVMPHEIIEHSEGFLVLAESYSPQSRTSPSYGYPPGYSPYSTTSPYYYSPYDPYYPTRRYPTLRYGENVISADEMKKIECIAINFNAAGNVTWDFSTIFKDLKVETVKQVSELYLEKDTLHILYKKEYDLVIKDVAIPTEESKEYTQRIRLMDVHAEIRSDDKHLGALERWYDNHLYVWGYQTIRNSSKSSNRTKDVFYVNKITIH